MSDTIQLVSDRLVEVFKSTDEVLNSWDGEANLQFPNLMGMIAL
jgi:hypothetical protein